MDHDELDLPRRALEAAGVHDDRLTPRHGWSNRAWVGERFVVRISSGRLVGSFAHEARVAEALQDTELRVASVVGHGTVADLFDIGLPMPARNEPPGEWIVSRRLPGRTLADRWTSLGETGGNDGPQRQIGISLGLQLAMLHATPVDVGEPQWWREAHEPNQFHNAYRPRAELGPRLVIAAREKPGADAALLDDLAAMLDDRLPTFARDRHVLVHGDIHGHNLLVDETRAGHVVSGIVDWEGAHPAAPDLELDMLLRWCANAEEFPSHPHAPPAVRPGAVLPLVDHVGSAYPELFDVKDLRDRLEVYEAHWQLVQLLLHHHNHDATAARFGVPPAPQWHALAELLRGRSHLDRFSL